MLNLEDILSKFPIFASLNKKGLKELVFISRLREFAKGEIVYKQKAPPHSLYILLAGRIKTYTESSKILEYLYKGTCFGIISCMTGQPHSVTAEAANDSLIVEIPKDKFRKFLDRYPAFSIDFSHLLSRRVKKRIDKDKTIFESCVISVYSLNQRIGKTTYSLVLGKALKEESNKKIIVLELRDEPTGFFFASRDKTLNLELLSEANFNKFIDKRDGFEYVRIFFKPQPIDTSKYIQRLLSHLSQSYNFIILDLLSKESGFITTALTQADFVHLLMFGDLKSATQLQKQIEFIKNKYRLKEENIKTILRDTTTITTSAFPELTPHPIFANLPFFVALDASKLIQNYPLDPYAKTIRRIAREISNVRIGLALGSGAAFGIAHIGVLKVLENAKIDIDIVSGTSMGSIITGLWGLGYNWKEIKMRIMKFKKFPVFSFWDIGFFKKSFLKGRFLKGILYGLFGNKTFYDLKRPVLIVSFDFIKRQAFVFSHGKFLLREAILASCSMPGIFEPVKTKEDLFLDGGVLNPLPVGCLIQEGVKKIISVNVTPSKEAIHRAYQEHPDKNKFTVLDFIFGSVEAMQREFIQSAISLSDIVIHPEFKDALWTDFKRIEYYIQQGEKEARKYIDKIKQLQKA
ncbi:MAG: patatin-like phospholipase family protein [Candidatus Omnitrophota bacterium]